jgi:hypothetical protein
VCETLEHIDNDCERCGKRKHAFFEDPVGDLLSHLCEQRSWSDRVVAIAHNARGYGAQFIIQRAILLKWKPDLILNGSKIMCMRMEHLLFIDSVSFLPMASRKLPEAFQLSARKSWYPHFFNTRENLNYVGPIPDIALYGVEAMSASERREFSHGTKNRKAMSSITDAP